MTSNSSIEPRRELRLALFCCLGITLFALALRLYNLGFQSIWLDEGHTAHRALLPIDETISLTIRKHHVPTYFIGMHYFLRWFGDDEFMLRLPSAIFGALAAGATCAAGYLLGRARVGLLAGFFVAIAPFQVRYSQEARMYSMISFTVALTLCSMLWIALHLDEASRSTLGTGKLFPRSADSAFASRKAKLAWATYIVGTVSTLYLHNTGILLPGTSCVAALVLLIVAKQRLRFAANFVAANVIVVLAWAPYLSTLFSQASDLSHNFWAGTPDLDDVLGTATVLYFFNSKSWPFVGALLGAAAFGIWRIRQQAHIGIVLAIFAVGPVAWMLLIALHTPMFLPRLMLWGGLPFFVLLALGIAGLRPWPLRFVLAASIAFVAWPAFEKVVLKQHKAPWREAAKVIRDRRDPSAVIIAPGTQTMVALGYYVNRSKERVVDLPFERVSPRGLNKALRGKKQMWCVTTRRSDNCPEYLKALGSRGQVIYKKVLDNRIVLYQVELRARAR